MPFPAVINVTELDGTNGFMINGTLPDGLFGYSVSGAGDVNGDGINDVIIGAPGVLGADNPKAGGAYVIFGKPAGFSSVFNVNNLSGKNGFVLQSIAEDNFIGFTSVNWAGDVNCDGIDDIIISNPYVNGYIGQAFIVFGSRSDFQSPFYLTSETLNGENGFLIEGYQVPSYLGAYVAGVGDVNADGKDDIAIGVLGVPEVEYEGTYIVWGSTDTFSSAINITQTDNAVGVLFSNKNIYGLGASGSYVGDINGDGIDDIPIGAFGTSAINSTSCIIFGSRASFPTNLALNGTNGFFLYGGLKSSLAGSWIKTAGDINGDGIKDLIIGSPNDETSIEGDGTSYVVFGSRQGFNTSIEMAAPDFKNGFTIPNLAISATAGSPVSGLGDVNGDGLDDFIIGSHGWNSNSGASYVIFGNRTGFPSILNITELNGENGFTIHGLPASGLGSSVSSAGDINADGVDDIIIGAPGASNNTGAAYVIYGQAPAPSQICSSLFNLSTLDGSNGFIISNIDTYLASSHSASGAGDVNGDGFDDIIIGSSNAPNDEGYGIVYIIYGSNKTFPYLVDATQLSSEQGFSISTTLADSYLGCSVSGAGDVNGDGLNDLIIGSSAVDGNSTIIFGRANGFGNITLPTNLTGIGFEYVANPSLSAKGAISVAKVNDFNGDGLGDLIIGAYYNNNYAGMVSIIYGQAHGFPSMLDAASLNTSLGLNIEGIDAYDYTGWSVSSAGDVNGDGLSDIIIGAWRAPSTSDAGAVYVVFGSRQIQQSTPPNLSKLDGSNGFKINGTVEGSDLGISVSCAGDFNGDGFDDVVIGAASSTSSSNVNAGTAYILFGHSGNFSSVIDVTTLDGINGTAISGSKAESAFGFSVSGAGDFNGDGLDDIIIGAPTINNGIGASYILYGQRNGFSPAINITSLNGNNGFVINGITTGDYFGTSVASASDINGDGLADVIINHGYPNTTAPGSKIGNAYVVFGHRCNSASPSPTPSFTPSNTVTSSITPSLSVTPSVTPSRTMSRSASDSLSPSSSSSAVPPSNTPTPSLIPSRTTQPSFSPSSSSGNSNSLLPLLIALPVGAFVLLFLVFGLYLHKKRASQNRYGFFSSEGVEPIPEAGEEIQLHASGRQMESYSSINHGDEAELLETYEGNHQSRANSYCVVM